MNIKFFNLAKQIAANSPSRFKIGTVIVHKNSIISVGWNDMTRTHPRSNSPFNYLHSEIHALIKSGRKQLKGSDVYIFRRLKNGNPACSKPCLHCYKALIDSGISNIYYTEENGFNQI